MVEARGDALEWAVALWKAPAERVALRQRPLPAGVETVLQIATGVPGDALADAVQRMGENEADICEAARFYVREILFYQGADAYRVLGLTRDAATDTLRTHHRLLQQWLHPDRHTSDWDAIFASRVNAAWNQLRIPTRRAEYDAHNPVHARDERGGPSWSMPVQLTVATEPAAIADDDRWRRRAPVLALFAICGLLGVLALRDLQREPVSQLPEQANAETAATQAEPLLTLHVPKAAPGEVARIAAESTSRQPVIGQAPKLQPKQLPPMLPVARPIPTAPLVASVSKPAPKPDPKAVAPVAASDPAARLIAAISRPVSRPESPPVISPPIKRAHKPVEIAALPKPQPKPVSTPTQKPLAPPVPNASPRAVTVAVSVAPVKPVAVAKAPPKPAAPAPVAQAEIKPEREVAKTPTQIKSAESTALSTPPPTPSVPVIGVSAANATASTTRATTQQVSQAQRTGQQLLAFVSSKGNAMPPIWDSTSSQAQASQVHASLQGGGRIHSGDPHWRIGGSTAAMSADVQAGSDVRRLKVNLVWREQRWLVSGLSLEQAP